MHKNQKLQKKRILDKKAFTLLELSIVLIVIGIMLAGIIATSGMIPATKLSVARSLTSRSVVPKIEGLVAWYDATSLESIDQDTASNGVIVSSWYDINPASIPTQNNTLITGNGTVSYLKKGINDIPSIQFGSAGTNNLGLSAFSQGTSSQNTVFIVFQQSTRSSPTGIRYILDSYTGNGVTALGYQDDGTDTIVMSFGTGAVSASSLSFQDDASYIISYYCDRTYSESYIKNSITPTSTVSPGSNLVDGLTVGSLMGNTSGFAGLISEIIIYDRVLRSQERKDIFTYLSTKYDISITGA